MGKMSHASVLEWMQGMLTTRSKRLQKDRKLVKSAHLHNEEEHEIEKNLKQAHLVTDFCVFIFCFI